jgi:hypothetical protein
VHQNTTCQAHEKSRLGQHCPLIQLTLLVEQIPLNLAMYPKIQLTKEICATAIHCIPANTKVLMVLLQHNEINPRLRQKKKVFNALCRIHNDSVSIYSEDPIAIFLSQQALNSVDLAPTRLSNRIQ